MANSSVVGTKGQVTIPRGIRARLGPKEGDRLEFVIEAGHMVICPVRKCLNPFDQYAGPLGTLADEAEINAWLQQLRDHDAP
jgi:antitoxin PrlF